MSKVSIVAVVVIGLLLGATMAWSADQVRDQVRDCNGDGVPDRDQEQLQDGSCKDAVALDQTRDQARDGTGDGVPDRNRTQEPARDGSCTA